MLAKTRNVPGDVVEMGVAHGGTSVMARKFIHRVRANKTYWAYDTYEGFVPEQFDEDVKKGMHPKYRTHFSANSHHLVRKIFDIHGVGDIKMVVGDVTRSKEYPN